MARSREDMDIVLRAQYAAASAFGALRSDLRNVQALVGRVGSALAGIGVGLAGAGVFSFARDAVKSLGDVADAAERVGTSTDAIQALRAEIQKTGGEAGQADSALERFGKAAAAAGTANDYLSKVLAANNVALKDQQGNLRSTDALLEDYARLVANAGSQQEKLMLSAEVFGRAAGPKMVGVLEQIAQQGFPAFIERAREAGQVVDKEIVKIADEFDERWTAAIKAVTNQLQTWVVQAMRAGEEVGRSLRTHVPVGRTLADVGISGAGPTRAEALARRGLGTTPASFEERFAAAEGSIRPMPRRGSVPTVIPRRTEEAAGAASRDALEQAEDQVRRRIAVLEAETRTIGMNAEARERARTAAQLEEAAIRANTAAGLENTAVTAAQRERIDQLAEAYAQAAGRAEQARGVMESFRELGSAGAEAFKAMAFEGKELLEVVKNLAARLRDRALDQLFNIGFQAIGSSIAGSFAGPGGGVLPGGLPLGLGGIGSRAGGGRVARGRPFEVGERGRELFVPDESGTIVPHGRYGGSISFSPVMNVDARGNTGNPRELADQLSRQMMKQFREQLPVLLARQQSLGKM